jgi:hypothetical protein
LGHYGLNDRREHRLGFHSDELRSGWQAQAAATVITVEAEEEPEIKPCRQRLKRCVGNADSAPPDRVALTGERVASFPASGAEFPWPGPCAFAVPVPTLVRPSDRSTSQMTWGRSWDFPPAAASLSWLDHLLNAELRS